MDWITGLQNAIDYVEEHLTEPIDYDEVAKRCYCSSYHFQRVFSILCGYTLGEYIRCRRLSLAAAELASTDAKVLDVALKYGYDSADGFGRAFLKFHGVLPRDARTSGQNLKSFSRLVLTLSLKGGHDMMYRIENKPAMILTGFKTHFTGAPYGEDREHQEEQLAITTRGKQWLLCGAANGGDAYCVITNVTDDGYDYYYTHILDEWTRDNLFNKDVTGMDGLDQLGFETLTIPQATYAVFETRNIRSPIRDYCNLLNQRIQILTEWMPEMGFQLKDAPELAVYHWNPRTERNVQIWLPIEKVK